MKIWIGIATLSLALSGLSAVAEVIVIKKKSTKKHLTQQYNLQSVTYDLETNKIKVSLLTTNWCNVLVQKKLLAVPVKIHNVDAYKLAFAGSTKMACRPAIARTMDLYFDPPRLRAGHKLRVYLGKNSYSEFIVTNEHVIAANQRRLKRLSPFGPEVTPTVVVPIAEAVQ